MEKRSGLCVIPKGSLAELGTIVVTRNNDLSDSKQLDHSSFTTYDALSVLYAAVQICQHVSALMCGKALSLELLRRFLPGARVRSLTGIGALCSV